MKADRRRRLPGWTAEGLGIDEAAGGRGYRAGDEAAAGGDAHGGEAGDE